MMTEATERALAHCEDCKKSYRVPDPERTYSCKACGGTVRAITKRAPSEEHHLQGAVTCDNCTAINHRGTHFCAECGQPLLVAPTVERNEEAVKARREATYQLKRGYKWIDGITWLYRLGALGYAAVTLIAVVALGSPEVPLQAGILVVALCTVLTVLMLMGAIQILFHPFVWTVTIAVLASAVSVVHLIGPNPLGLASFWSAGWAVLFWVAVVPTLWFRRLMAEHLDTYITHHSSRLTKRTLEGRSARERHERLLGVMRRAAMRAWKLSAMAGGGIALASLLASYTVYANVRPAELVDSLGGFETAWNAADFAAIGRFFPAKIQDRETVRLAGITEGHGWGDSLPRIEGGQTREVEDETWVDYELDGVNLSTSWFLDDRTWYLIQIQLPEPPLEPVLERFYAAWRRSDADAIGAFFPEGHQERMAASVERSAERRSWKTLPKIQRTQRAEPNEDGEVVVTLSVDSGDVTTKWVFRVDGRWGLHGIQFPKP